MTLLLTNNINALIFINFRAFFPYLIIQTRNQHGILLYCRYLNMIMAEISEWIDRLEVALTTTDEPLVNSIIDEARSVISPLDCSEYLISPVLSRIGVGWQEGKISLSQVYLGSKMCEKALDRILPSTHQRRRTQPKMAIAVLEDYHNLGQKIVLSALRAGGFEILNYERQDVASLVSKAKEDGIEILLISTLMYRSALKVKDLRKEMEANSIRPVLLVGGAPFFFDKELWIRVGADDVGYDASSANSIIRAHSEGGQ